MLVEDDALLEFFHQVYEYRDGHLYYKVNRRPRMAGDRVGSNDGTGYIKTEIYQQSMMVHRIIFAMHHGFFPQEVDHINRIRNDNRLENLRACNRRENTHNMPAFKSRAGAKNVIRKAGKWVAVVRINGKHRRFGAFDTIAEADAAARAARQQFHGEFANHGVENA